MQITDIKKDKKHLTRIVFSDGNEQLLDKDVCDGEGLFVGYEVDCERLEELKYESDYKRAKSRAMWYLDRMDYTERALYEKLVKAGFGKKASAAVLAYLCKLGLVDDRRYAERFAERCIEGNISKREAYQKMLLKGVSPSLAKEILSELECNEEAQIAALIEKKYAQKLADERGHEKVFAALARKGFSFSAIKSALKKYSEELEFCEEY